MSSEPPTQQAFPTIGLKVTCKCDLFCPFCCEPDRNQEEFSISSFKRIIKILKDEYKTKRLCLTGGDPLCRDDLSEILKFAKSSEIFTLLLTSDGKRLLSISDEILSSVDAVRISVHGLYDDHDKIVKRNGAFQEIETAVEFLHSKNIPIMVTTVVTPKCIDHIENIADWAYSIHSTQYYLFGLMRSGKGNNFINKNEMIKPNWIESINAKVKEKYFGKMEVVYYGYENKGECVIVYGDGKILIDPYPGESTHQKILGNLLTDTKDHILKAFNEDPENSVGYDKHCKNI